MQVSRSLQSALNMSRQIFIFICAALFMVTTVQAQDAPAADKPAGFAPESIEKGRKMYKQLCLRCHGPEMVGGNNAYDLRVFPQDQPERFLNSVSNGKRAMPPWKGILSEEEITHLWSYVGSRGGKS
jgi:mono/diheme cytochrome c family protein